jgi:tRNA threonylcarbamoyladenosine biosynthesis protein TsaB
VIVLALDTTTRAGSAAVVRDGDVLAELRGNANLTHGERLPGELIRTLETGGVPLGEVDLLAVAAGPGSFTGLRVGIAAMQGLATATGRRIVPVSVFEALARSAGAGGAPLAVWIDAQRGQVFAVLYDAAAGRGLTEPTSLPPAETLAAWKAAGIGGTVRFVGDGAVRYRPAIEAALGAGALMLPDPAPLAGVIGRIAAEQPERAVLPHAVVPIYVRRPDAELARRARVRGSRQP